MCLSFGVEFLASVWDVDALDYIDEFITKYKIGSGDLTAHNLLQKIVERGKPIILSTGLSTLEEVVAAVEFIKNADSSYVEQKKLALMQCTAMYPIPDIEANLNVMHTLREKTDLPVGYSDHTVGMDALEVAVAMGAEIIEKHFTDRREGKTFRDHKVSATKDEMQAFIEKVKKIRTLQGGIVKRPTPSELEEGHVTSFRRGVYPARNVKAGEIVRDEDLITLRPCRGIGAESFYALIGKRARSDLIKHQELSMDYFEEDEHHPSV
jgi:N-acetylneuraminate synthase/N,N'-diacetyllegionaminate synthase